MRFVLRFLLMFSWMFVGRSLFEYSNNRMEGIILLIMISILLKIIKGEE